MGNKTQLRISLTIGPDGVIENLSELISSTILNIEMLLQLRENQILTASEFDHLQKNLNAEGASYLYNRIYLKFAGNEDLEEKFLLAFQTSGNDRALRILQYTPSGISSANEEVQPPLFQQDYPIIYGVDKSELELDIYEGRQDDFLWLEEHCTLKDTFKLSALISGLGGIGKTWLVKKFLKTFRQTNSSANIIWINGGRSELTSSVLAFLKDTESDPGNNTDLAFFEKILKSIPKEQKTLLIIDNLEEVSNFLNFIFYPLNSISIIITSRDCLILDGEDHGLKMSVLSTSDAEGLLQRLLGNSNSSQGRDPSIHELCKVLHNFPLSLIEAANYIRQTQKLKSNYKIQDFLNEFACNRKQIQILCKYFPQSRRQYYSHSSYLTWDSTVDDIVKQTNLQLPYLPLILLKIASFGRNTEFEQHNFYDLSKIEVLAKQGVWEKVHHNCSHEKYSEFQESDVEDSIRILMKFSMLETYNEQNKININKVVQIVTRLKNQGRWKPDSEFIESNGLLGDVLKWEFPICKTCGGHECPTLFDVRQPQLSSALTEGVCMELNAVIISEKNDMQFTDIRSLQEQ